MSGTTLHPEVLWAQRSSATEAEKNFIYLTIMAPDVPESDLKLDLQPTKLTFSGPSQSKKATYAVELEFYAEIDPKESKIHHTARDIELVLRKKDLKEEYWPRLLKESKKMHFLKTNFDKWVDEDEQDEVPDDDDYMSKMNPMGAGGMGGMGDMGGMGGEGGFGGIDFSKLGVGGGANMDFSQFGNMANMGNMGGDDSDDDDDDMPELENEEAKSAGAKDTKEGEAASKPKIEEVA